MKKFLITLLIIILVACGTAKYTMHNAINDNYNIEQIDSICLVEHIPSDFTRWDSLILRDEESKKKISQYFYVTGNDTLERVYTVTKVDSIFKVKKRVTNIKK